VGLYHVTLNEMDLLGVDSNVPVDRER